MKKLDFNIPLLNQNVIETLVQVENEIRMYTGCGVINQNFVEKLEKELNEACEIFEGYVSDFDMKQGNFNDEYYKYLYDLMTHRTQLNGYLALQLLEIFRYRRDNMSLKYISKRLKLSIEALIIWFDFEGVEMFEKRGCIYVKFNDFLEFYKMISAKNYQRRKKTVQFSSN